MDKYELPNADDFEVFGHYVETGRFDVHKVVDTHHRQCWLFRGSSIIDSVSGFETHYAEPYVLKIMDDEWLTVSVRGRDNNYQLPSMLQSQLPFVDCDNFFARNIMQTIRVCCENGASGMVNTLEREKKADIRIPEDEWLVDI